MAHQNGIALREGYKFAALALPRLNAVTGGQQLMIAEEGYALTSQFPLDDFENWRKTVGASRYESVINAKAFLVVYARSKSPGVLDHETRALSRRLHRFHLGKLCKSSSCC